MLTAAKIHFSGDIPRFPEVFLKIFFRDFLKNLKMF